MSMSFCMVCSLGVNFTTLPTMLMVWPRKFSNLKAKLNHWIDTLKLCLMRQSSIDVIEVLVGVVAKDENVVHSHNAHNTESVAQYVTHNMMEPSGSIGNAERAH